MIFIIFGIFIFINPKSVVKLKYIIHVTEVLLFYDEKVTPVDAAFTL